MSTKAKKKRSAQGPSPDPVLPAATRFGLFLARLWTGVFFLVTAEYKLNQPGRSLGESIDIFREGEFTRTLENAIAHPPELFGHPVPLVTDVLESVILPGAGFFAPAILFFEVVLGLFLVLGLGVRLTAALGFVLMMFFNLAKVQPGAGAGEPAGVFLFTVRTANWPLTLLLLILCLAAAGRILGLDAWIRAKAPRWLRWIG